MGTAPPPWAAHSKASQPILVKKCFLISSLNLPWQRKDISQGGDRENMGAVLLWRAQIECKSCKEITGGNWSNRSGQSAPVGAREISESASSVNLRGSQLPVYSVFVLQGKHLHRLQMNCCFCTHYCTDVWKPQSYCGRAGLQPRQRKACGCCIHGNSSFHFQSFDSN